MNVDVHFTLMTFSSKQIRFQDPPIFRVNSEGSTRFTIYPEKVLLYFINGNDVNICLERFQYFVSFVLALFNYVLFNLFYLTSGIVLTV